MNHLSREYLPTELSFDIFFFFFFNFSVKIPEKFQPKLTALSLVWNYYQTTFQDMRTFLHRPIPTKFYFHQYFQFYILTNSYLKSPHFSSPTHHNSNQLIGFTFSIVLIIFLWLGCLKLILCLVSAWSKWGCVTNFFLLPRLVCMLCVCFFLISLIYWFSLCNIFLSL